VVENETKGVGCDAVQDLVTLVLETDPDHRGNGGVNCHDCVQWG
jgi:hypothetical protein